MPTLHWIGKDKVINHHLDVPYKVLDAQYTYNTKDDSGNKIIHGDNLEALKALLPEYEGKIKCIYIDPPYNTGNESWVYNDNVNDPKIKKWLGEVVGKESEDLTRHDKWLCMMYPRLKLLHRLLAQDGAIFISIDDNELAHLRLLMDEIFGNNNFVEYFIWTKTSTPPSLANKSRKTVEYIICYEKRKSNKNFEAELSDGGDAPLLNSGNPICKILFPKDKVVFKLPNGILKAGQYDKAYLHNDIELINGYSNKDFELSGEFKWIQSTVDAEIEIGTTFLIKSNKFSIRFQRTEKTFKAPTNLLKEKYLNTTINKTDNNVDTNEGAKKILIDIFKKDIFSYPKPYSLIEFLLQLATDKDSIILDSFAGSGTTAHAVLNLNKQDGGQPQVYPSRDGRLCQYHYRRTCKTCDRRLRRRQKSRRSYGRRFWLLHPRATPIFGRPNAKRGSSTSRHPPLHLVHRDGAAFSSYRKTGTPLSARQLPRCCLLLLL